MKARTRWSPSTVVDAMRMLDTGVPAASVAAKLGVPVGTVRAWGQGRVPDAARHLLAGGALCSACGGQEHEWNSGPGPQVAYLLGVYLGDGCLTRQTRTWSLRVTLDIAHPGVIDEVCAAITDVRGRSPNVHRPRGENYVVLTSYWRAWPCWLGPYEPGKKHERRIALHPWQRDLIRHHAGAFARGLVHTDGWRGENRVRSKGRDYSYPRYQFSNRSEEIRRLFTDACDVLGVAWRPWGPHHVSVARRDAVALLDEHVGPKR